MRPVDVTSSAYLQSLIGSAACHCKSGFLGEYSDRGITGGGGRAECRISGECVTGVPTEKKIYEDYSAGVTSGASIGYLHNNVSADCTIQSSIRVLISLDPLHDSMQGTRIHGRNPGV